MRTSVGILLAAAAAYAFSFATDLLLGGLVGVYPSTAYLPGMTWSLIAAVLLLVAGKLIPRRRWLALPFAAFGALALFGALVGPHPHNYGVAALLLIQALIIRWLAPQPVSVGSFPVGGYTLNMQIVDGADLDEFSADQYRVMGRRFVGERNFHAAPVEFEGRRWKLMLGTVNGILYKLAPYLEFQDKAEANEVALGTLSFCTRQLGKPTKQQTGLFVWDTSDCNVILQTAEIADGFAVSIFLTSGRVREFPTLIGPKIMAPEPLFDVNPLRKLLLNSLGGDKAALERLIEYERRRQSSADEKTLLEAVRERLDHDRR